MVFHILLEVSLRSTCIHSLFDVFILFKPPETGLFHIFLQYVLLHEPVQCIFTFILINFLVLFLHF